MRNTLLQAMTTWIKGCGLCLLVILVISLSTKAQTQITSGVIQGTVTDEAGAVVPGASVEVRNAV